MINETRKWLPILLALFLPLLFAFTAVNCWQNYVDDWNATMAKYERDTARCSNAWFPETCQMEPDETLRRERAANITALHFSPTKKRTLA